MITSVSYHDELTAPRVSLLSNLPEALDQTMSKIYLDEDEFCIYLIWPELNLSYPSQEIVTSTNLSPNRERLIKMNRLHRLMLQGQEITEQILRDEDLISDFQATDLTHQLTGFLYSRTNSIVHYITLTDPENENSLSIYETEDMGVLVNFENFQRPWNWKLNTLVKFLTNDIKSNRPFYLRELREGELSLVKEQESEQVWKFQKEDQYCYLTGLINSKFGWLDIVNLNWLS